MKPERITRRIGLISALLSLTLAPAATAYGGAPHPGPVGAYGNTWNPTPGGNYDLRDSTFGQRGEFLATYQAMFSKLSAKVDRLRASYVGALADQSKKSAMHELAAVAPAFRQSLSAAANASPLTWDAARHDVVVLYEKYQRAYQRAVQSR